MSAETPAKSGSLLKVYRLNVDQFVRMISAGMVWLRGSSSRLS